MVLVGLSLLGRDLHWLIRVSRRVLFDCFAVAWSDLRYLAPSRLVDMLERCFDARAVFVVAALVFAVAVDAFEFVLAHFAFK